MIQAKRGGAFAYWALACALGVSVTCLACEREQPELSAGVAHAGLEKSASFAALRSEETQLRALFEPRSPPDARGALGPDPSRIVRLHDGRFVAALATPGSVALLTEELSQLDRVAAPPGATALAVDANGTLFVGSKTSPDLSAFTVLGDRLGRSKEQDRSSFARYGVRALAAAAGCLYAVDEVASRLVWSCREASSGTSSVPVARAPTDITVTQHFAAITSPVGHAISVFRLTDGVPDAEPLVILRNDGPFFGTAILERPDGSLIVASGGVENRPLDRSGGSFGYIDSFLYVSEIEGDQQRPIATLNVSDLGVMTPKALTIAATELGVRIQMAGYGSGAGASIDIALDSRESSPTTRTFQSVPGIASLLPTQDGELVGVSPLLDTFVRLRNGEPPRLSPARPEPSTRDGRLPPTAVLRLGEALFFTEAMGPFQLSADVLSRFSCETCHFEGGIDGRLHRTGRGDTTATTKPLFGLANNGPHFTRALDDDLSEMVFAEFRVAEANTGHSDWFNLEEAELDWLEPARLLETPHSPADLRRALLLYLAMLPHPPNPRASHPRFTALEQRGQALFASQCEGCHAARLVASDPRTRVPTEDWEALVLSNAGPIVWARAGYEATGIEPRVHPDGARPSSLRRIVDKTPYFTNGSAVSLAAVLTMARRSQSGAFLHAGGPEQEQAITPADHEALLAFLELL